jgi:Leucine-rich repeat (LRR) protein
LIYWGCEEEDKHGCLDSQACNYDSEATIENNSCEYLDCNNECGGDAVLDSCGVCDDDLSNDCVQDCAGDWGENVELWGDCYNIENTTELIRSYSNNTTVGNIPPEIGALTNLTILKLFINGDGIEIPPEIGNLTNLEILSLGGNVYYSGSIPMEIWDLTNLRELRITSNYDTQLTGSIPSEIGNLINLEILSIGAGITGEIPPEIGNLTNLTFLSFYENQLTGSIPSEIGNLTNLTGLALSRNQLTGSIPPEIGDLTNLETLSLSDNQLTGEIPNEIWSLLINLTSFTVNGNQLTGQIPESICDFYVPDVSTLQVFDNQFCPPYPSCIYVGDQDTGDCP